MGPVPCAGLTMMRQEERSLRTIIMVMVNTPLRSGMRTVRGSIAQLAGSLPLLRISLIADGSKAACLPFVPVS